MLDIYLIQEGYKESLKSAREGALQGGFENGFSEGYAQGLLAGRVIGISSYVSVNFVLYQISNLSYVASSAIDLASTLGFSSKEGLEQVLKDAKALNTESARKADDFVSKVRIFPTAHRLF